MAKLNITTNTQEDPGDPCNSYEWSIVFCFTMVLSLIAWSVAIFMTITSSRRLGSSISGLDRIFFLLAFVSFIQFGPMLTSALHSGHNTYSYSQTGCKMMFFTEYGTRHVITGLVLCLLAWAYCVLHHGLESVDGKIKSFGMGWTLLIMALVEGLFGMVPAMYIDLSPNHLYCGFTASMNLTLSQVVSMEILLRPVIPYILPAIIGLPMVVYLHKMLPDVQEATRKTKLKIVLLVVGSYFLINLPYAIILCVEYGLMSTLHSVSYATVCNFKWFFFLVHQSWYLLTPLVLILVDPDVDTTSATQFFNKFKKMYDDRLALV